MDVTIPDEALNSHIAILGKVGSGKTYTAKGLVERLLQLRRQVAIIDPTGAWYGLRTGFEIPIFGGRHGDIDIGDAAGEAVARVIVEQRTSAIVDLSLLSGGAQRRFMRGFAHRLRAKPPGAFYLVIDEADEFLPQQLSPDMTNLFGDLKWMVRRGRLNGFRVMMITQRPAEIAKAVLTQIETLVAHRLTAPQDRKAIEEWVKGHHAPEEAREVLSTLASLDKGEAWVWAPDLGLLKRAAMPAIATFDSGRTPEPGETDLAPPELARLDLSGIAEALATATGGDESKAGKTNAAPTWPDQRQEVERLTVDLNKARARAIDAEEHLRRVRLALDTPPSKDSSRSGDWSYAPVPAKPAARAARASTDGKQNSGTAGETAPSPTAASIAELLDRLSPARLTWAQAAAMVKRKPIGGSFNTARKWLRESGRIIEEGEFVRSSAERPQGLTRQAAVDLWRAALVGSAIPMFDKYLEGRPLNREELGAALGIAARGGSFNHGFAQLRNNGLIHAQGDHWSITDPLPGERA